MTSRDDQIEKWLSRASITSFRTPGPRTAGTMSVFARHMGVGGCGSRAL